MSRTVLRLVLAAFVSWTWVLAQEPVYILKVDVPYVSVDVSVQDTAGRTVTDTSARCRHPTTFFCYSIGAAAPSTNGHLCKGP